MVLWLSPFAIFAEASSGTEGASFLDIPVGAGPAALGSAYSAAATDAYAPIYNPAGLGFVSHPEIAGQHLSYLESTNYEFGSIVIPLHGVTPAEAGAQNNGLGSGFRRNDNEAMGALGFSVQYFGSGDISGTGTSGEAIGDFSVHYAAYSLAYGQRITEKLALGLTGKLIDAKIADTSAKAYAGDAGAMYQASDNVTLSATANNLGSKLTFTNQGDSLPTAYHLGAAFRLQNSLKSTVEGVYNKSGLLSGRAGFEWSPMEMISLRTGYKTDTIKGLSPLAGLTVGMGLRLFGQEFAYAWLPYGDLGNTQYFSLLIKFGAQDEARKNLIQYQDIKRIRTVKQHRSGTENSSGGIIDQREEIQKNDPEYQQLMQLLSDEPELNALAPIVGVGR